MEQENQNSPISYKGEYHVRSGSTKQELKGTALDQFLLKRYGRRWDGVPVPQFSVSDCSQDAFKLFKLRAAKSGRVSESVLSDTDESLLDNLQLTEGAYIKRAATLLFFNEPERYTSGAYIKVGFFVTDDDLRYQDEIHGHLLAQVERAMDLIYSKYLKAHISYQGLQRLETFLFPQAALREALLNAVVHKDYSSGIPIQISVYADKIVLWGAGQLPHDWTVERLLEKHPSVPPNPLIANAFFRAGYIESWGRGIEKINRACTDHGIRLPHYDYGMSGLMVTFSVDSEHRPKDAIAPIKNSLTKNMTVEKKVENSTHSAHPTKATTTPTKDNLTVEKKVEKLNDTSYQLLNQMLRKPSITLQSLAIALQKSPSTVERTVQRLVKNGLIVRTGPRKGGQ